MLTAADVRAKAAELGFVACGIARADADAATRFIFHQRIDLGYYDGLPWFTHERADRATDPRTALDGAATVITLAAPYKTRYCPTAHDGDPDAGLRGRVARYAWGRDYHRVLEKKLRALAAFIAERCAARSRPMVDYAPLAERSCAARAGIGWFGKSTNLLLPGFGSWVLLAELVTTAPLDADQALRKSCGSCARCIAACPTGAIAGPYVIDNRRCISFQTIENRGTIPHDLRPLLGDWVFGCDLCQDACPVGRGAADAALPEFRPASLDAALPELTDLLRLSEEQFRARFAGRAIMRARRTGLARNACVALGNLGDPRAVPALARALREDPSPLVRGHAAWALARIGGATARRVLDAAFLAEKDTMVRDEIVYALSGAVVPADGAGICRDRRAWLAGPWRQDVRSHAHESSATCTAGPQQSGRPEPLSVSSAARPTLVEKESSSADM